MKRLIAATLSLSLLAATGAAFAAPPRYDNDRDTRDRHDQRDDRGHGPSRGHDRHEPPRRGGHLQKDHRGDYVSDYKRHGLHAPKRGQQWRKVDNRYVLIAVATGLIADVVLNGR
jgi:Ni/Co efflux regulator RcnB